MSKRSRREAWSPDRTDDGRYRVVPVEEVELVKKLKETFRQMRARYTGDSRACSARSDRWFFKAAQICMETGESPEDFVVRQIDEAISVGAPLYPQVLCSNKLHLRRELSQERDRRESLAWYRSQLDLFHSRTTILSSVPIVQILLDPHVSLSPLFRYCMAKKLGLGPVAECYREDARIELRLHPVAAELFDPEASTVWENP